MKYNVLTKKTYRLLEIVQNIVDKSIMFNKKAVLQDLRISHKSSVSVPQILSEGTVTEDMRLILYLTTIT